MYLPHSRYNVKCQGAPLIMIGNLMLYQDQSKSYNLNLE